MAEQSTQDTERKRNPTLREILESVADQIAAVAPAHIKVDRIIKMALLAARKNPKIVTCTPSSVVDAVIQIASLGLEIGRTAHMVPFNTKVGDKWVNVCQYIIDVKGIAQAIIQSGEVMAVDARVAREGDVFRVLYGTKPDIEHEPIIGNEGDIIAFYAVFTLPNGDKKFEVMSKAEVDKVKASSKSKDSGPWVTWYDEMGKKTVVKRGAKLIPMTERVHDLIDADNREYEDDTPAAPPAQAPAQRGKSRTLAALSAPQPNPLDELERASREPEGVIVDADGRDGLGIPVSREPGEEG